MPQQIQEPRNMEFLFVLLFFPILCLAETIQHQNLSVLIPPRIECSLEIRPPGYLRSRDCERFLYRLAAEARQEPTSAYKWYGRHIDPCPECVQLPAKVTFGFICEVKIDVDEADDKELSIFGLRDLVRALQGVEEECWKKRRRTGRGFPDSQKAWATFVKNEHPTGRALGNETVSFGGQDGELIDLNDKVAKT
ncbi:MAG: hypothetical protein Q9200_001626 [Gallowayella weberi]